MLCFRDKTFCSSDCERVMCHRHFGPADQAAADRWWNGPGAPVAFADFSGRCSDYLPPLPAENGAGRQSASEAKTDRPTAPREEQDQAPSGAS
jgi:hypothetical protein